MPRSSHASQEGSSSVQKCFWRGSPRGGASAALRVRARSRQKKLFSRSSARADSQEQGHRAKKQRCAFASGEEVARARFRRRSSARGGSRPGPGRRWAAAAGTPRPGRCAQTAPAAAPAAAAGRAEGKGRAGGGRTGGEAVMREVALCKGGRREEVFRGRGRRQGGMGRPSSP